MTRLQTDALLRGAVTLALASALTLAAGRSDTRLDVAESTTPGAAATSADSAQLICPGTELAGVSGVADIDTSTQVVADFAPDVALGAAVVSGPGSLAGRDLSDGAPLGVATSKRQTAFGVELTSPFPLRLVASGSLAPGLTASSESLVDTAVARGLMGVACGMPAAESWLIGGAEAPGRQERILLVNSGANPVTVDLDVFGRTGQIAAPAAQGITVPAQGRTTFLLDAVAGSEAAPLVRVRTRGGLVQALLNDSWLDGITPRGVENVGATAAPALRQVLPAVPGGLAGRVRVAAVGDEPAVVSVRVLTSKGPVVLPKGSGVATLANGESRDFPFGALTGDALAIEVTADHPIVAAALTEVVAKGVRDFAWSPAAPAGAGLVGTAYPVGKGGDDRIRRTLSLVATGGAARARVVFVGTSGVVSQGTVALAADSSAAVSLDGTRAVWVLRSSGPGELRAGLISATGEGATRSIAARPLAKSRVSAQDIAVVPLPE